MAKRTPINVEVRAGDGRTLDFIASTSGVARDGGIIDLDGWKLDEFRSNPVFLWAHLSDQPPIGKVEEIGVKDGALRARVRFAGEAEAHPQAETIFRLYKGGFLNTVSVGFDVQKPRDVTPEEREAGARWASAETALYELSGVPVPADVGAVATKRGIRAGGLTKRDAHNLRVWSGIEAWERLAKAIEEQGMKRQLETVEGGFALVLRDAADFDEGSLESREWESDPAIMASVGIMEGEYAVQALAFPAEDWTEEAAASWVEENEASVLEWREAVSEDEEEAEEPTDEEMSGEPSGERLDEDERADALARLSAMRDELSAMIEALGGKDEPSEDEEADESRALADLRAELNGLRGKVRALEDVTGLGGLSGRVSAGNHDAEALDDLTEAVRDGFAGK